MSSISTIPADFAFSREFETFRRAFMCFHFWHKNILPMAIGYQHRLLMQPFQWSVRVIYISKVVRDPHTPKTESRWLITKILRRFWGEGHRHDTGFHPWWLFDIGNFFEIISES